MTWHWLVNLPARWVENPNAGVKCCYHSLLLLGKPEGKCSRVSYSLTLNKRTLISNAVYSWLESLWQSRYLGDYQEAHFQFSYQTYPEGSMLFKALQYLRATASHFENSTSQCLIWIWSMEDPKSFVSQFLEFLPKVDFQNNKPWVGIHERNKC